MSRLKVDFNRDWKFKLGKNPKAEEVNFDDSAFSNVLLPHDWSIYGEFKKHYETSARGGYRPSGFGCYRKTFFVPEEYKGKKIEIEFGGIYRKATVYINGKRIAFWINGWISKTIDISKYLMYGKDNVIFVRADNTEQPASRYYTGCGIYRDVCLFVRDKVYIKNFAPFVTTPKIDEKTAEVNVELEVKNEFNKDKKIRFHHVVFDNSEKLAEFTSESFTISALKTKKLRSKLTVQNPKLWDTEQPNLYTLKTEIVSNGKVMDESEVKFGIRELKFDKDEGFFLNGKPTLVKGVCLHHDNGCLGAVANKEYERRKIQVMKEMGANAIRLSHNPVSTSFLDLCDEMGMLVMDEFFDEWEFPKYMLALVEDNSPDKIIVRNYHNYFYKNYKNDLTDTLIRDRNHPSIFMYSIGNEIPEQRYSIIDGEKNAIKLRDLVKKYDTTRPVTCACCFDQKGAENTGFCDRLDVAGYNYAEVLYEIHHKRFPNRPIIGSETTSVTPFWKRGHYDFKVLSEINKRMDLKLGEMLVSDSDRIRSAEFSMRMHRDLKFIEGMFIWTGIDYFGEPTPYTWPSRSSYFGVCDTCCFPKDAFYFYKSFWDEKTPTLHLFPHWNLGKEMIGKKLNVIAYTNCFKVELFINGKSQGMKLYDSAFGEHINWEVAYEPGELKAWGYDKNGNLIATDVINTAGKPESIRLTVNKNAIKSDRRDICFIKAELLDKDGNIVPDDDRIIHFTVSNDVGKIIGVDNGDPEYIGDLKTDKIPTLAGLSLAVIGTTGKTGSFLVTASSKGLRSAEVTIESLK